jgi:CheY-like chemotaxis protein
VVEDEYAIAVDIVFSFQEAGATIVGPAASIDDALKLIREEPRIDCAVVDLNLRGHMAFPVADALAERGIPYIFATGYDPSVVPSRHANVTLCEKPVTPSRIAEALLAVC